MSLSTLSIRTWAVLLGLTLAVIYLPGLGHGFIKDDFLWIADSRVETTSDLVEVLTSARGFYRPVVSLSFAINYWALGLEPFGYGLTNLALVLAVAAAVWRLGRALGLSSGGALLAAAFWSLNFHGIRMAVLWISGRTALLLTLCSVLAAHAVVRGRPAVAAAWALAAMLSKEEAVVLPVVLLAWGVFAARDDGRRPGPGGHGLLDDLRRVAARQWPLLAALAAYLGLRAQSGAMLPSSAPEAYRFTLEADLLATNVLEYFDRAATLPAAAAVVLSLVAWRAARLPRSHRRWIAMGGIWAAGGYALTVFLPIRSSLYACLPSVGAALAGAAYLEALWEQSPPTIRTRLLAVGMIAALVAVPVHWSRNQSWIRPAEVSALVMDAVVDVADAVPPGGGVLIAEDLDAPTRMEHAFGTLIQTAASLYIGRPLAVWIDPPPRDAALDHRSIPDPQRIAVRLAVDGNRVVTVHPPR